MPDGSIAHWPHFQRQRTSPEGDGRILQRKDPYMAALALEVPALRKDGSITITVLKELVDVVVQGQQRQAAKWNKLVQWQTTLHQQ
ncbi:unnamed protein product [Heligmosomoides polygyrus]|uniref:Uncharacterized protein n=1 Tax=Heligmosomoides polygyrus TaxID=6339 RepID=A0A183GBJ8_HELPZ|nr:unnamed protein product [Heligmosomoides polygyrus]